MRNYFKISVRVNKIDTTQKSHGNDEQTLGNNQGDTVSIDINKKVALFPDIVSISHITSAAAIKTQLNKNRNCFKPVLRSRLL